jgi:hypothetical protein
MVPSQRLKDMNKISLRPTALRSLARWQGICKVPRFAEALQQMTAKRVVAKASRGIGRHRTKHGRGPMVGSDRLERPGELTDIMQRYKKPDRLTRDRDR